jgi:hypothetical protein
MRDNILLMLSYVEVTIRQKSYFFQIPVRFLLKIETKFVIILKSVHKQGIDIITTHDSSGSKILITDISGETVIKEFNMDEHAKAHDYARDLELMGVDVSIHIPSVAETLALELGADAADMKQIESCICEEIESHN